MPLSGDLSDHWQQNIPSGNWSGASEGESFFSNHTNSGSWCDYWREPQHLLFQLANAVFAISYAAPSSPRGAVFMHSALILGFMLFSIWAWNIICAPDIFSWNLSMLLFNVGQLVHIIYQLRPIKFDPELEEIFQTLFNPFKVHRLQFKKLVSSELSQIMSLHAGEAYALQDLTSTDRLGLLLSGKVNVLSDGQLLHPILPCEFLDSPEFESSRSTADDKFKVSIVAASTCRYLYWQRNTLEYFLAKETFLATVLTTLIARDIATKLYAMNRKIVTDKGSHLDIRLPSVTSTLTPGVLDIKSPRKRFRSNCLISSLSPDSVFSSRERLCPRDSLCGGTTGDDDRLSRGERNCGILGDSLELTPLAKLPNNDDLISASGVESWLETSSKYHSCEVVDD